MEDRFEIRSFGFRKYTRQVNHVVAYLDRITVWDRVRKDDPTVMDLMPGFTLTQITEFIAAAQEANATNVLAALRRKWLGADTRVSMAEMPDYADRFSKLSEIQDWCVKDMENR